MGVTCGLGFYFYRITETLHLRDSQTLVLKVFYIIYWNETHWLHTEKYWRSVFAYYFSQILPSISSECLLGRLRTNNKLKLCSWRLLMSDHAELDQAETCLVLRTLTAINSQNKVKKAVHERQRERNRSERESLSWGVVLFFAFRLEKCFELWCTSTNLVFWNLSLSCCWWEYFQTE